MTDLVSRDRLPTLTDHRYPLAHVWINPHRQSGEPCILDTRIPVWLIVGLLADGVEPRHVKRFYPGVSAEVARKASAWWRDWQEAHG